MPDPIRAAMDALQAAIPCAKASPARPRFHFTAPSHWLNDPNGTIYHNGYYHLFYQHHPFSDEWGPMHWGHARSTDLLHWEHLPIALYPEGDGVENGIFSGCVVINKHGQPMAFYTRANHPKPEGTEDDFTQAVAFGSADLLKWEKREAPLLTREGPAADYLRDWRDPFIFHAEERTFLTVGMTGKGLPIYEATDGSLLNWEHKGVLHDDDAECPNFFEVDGHWVYLWSPFDSVGYAIGGFDTKTLKFTPETHGRYDWSEFKHSNYYATNHLYAPDGRSILFGWIRGWKPGMGWNGCMGIPREVQIGADGRLRTPPIEEMNSLRQPLMDITTLELSTGSTTMQFDPSQQYELSCELILGNAAKMGFGLCTSPQGISDHALWLQEDGIHLDGVHIQLDEYQPSKPVAVRLFIDHAVAELFVDDGRYCAVRAFHDYIPANTRLKVFADGENTVLRGLQVWKIVTTQ
ncbi:MAG: glycoside hydrolase family 32 protein [Anaerolineae bacterium]|jgi:beta-fructofuranosidase|nr:glycoside hydrolase family 32 protein [Anaerolineae bacterium]